MDFPSGSPKLSGAVLPMELPRAHGTPDRLTPQDQVLSIICGRVAHKAWGKTLGSPQKATSDALLGCPRP
eukprot:636919-Karenia_brevis.AAC.1